MTYLCQQTIRIMAPYRPNYQQRELRLCLECTLFTVPLFSRKTVEIENLALRAASLHKCQNYLGSGGRFGRGREKFFSLASLPLEL